MPGAGIVTLAALLATALAGCSSDASASAGTPGPVCNTLVDDGPTVTATVRAGMPPAASGGTIAEGTYFLSALNYYTGTTATNVSVPGTFSAIFQISGNVIQQVGHVSGSESRYTTTFSTSGSALTGTDTCPAAKTDVTPFSASATGFSVYEAKSGTSATIEEIYTLR